MPHNANAQTRASWVALRGGTSVFIEASPSGVRFQALRAFSMEPVPNGLTVDMLAPAAPGTGRLGGVPLGVLVWDYHNFGLWAQAIGASPNVRLQLLQSRDDIAVDYVVPETGGNLVVLADNAPHIVAVTPITMQYLSLRATGQMGGIINGPDTVVTVELHVMG